MTNANPHHTPSNPAATDTDPYAQADWPALLDVLAVNTAIPETRFDARHWCGTKMCLLGHWCAARPNDKLRISKGTSRFTLTGRATTAPFTVIEQRFGISIFDAIRLFGSTVATQEAAIGTLIAFIQDNVPEQHQAALMAICRTPQAL